MTLPRGGWDFPRVLLASHGLHFNPPTPWGVGHGIHLGLTTQSLFQSTHPVGGGTPAEVGQTAWQVFQSTHPVGGGTALALCEVLEGRKFQSTHPVGGGTSTNFATPSLTSYFNPPTPWGVGLFNHEPISRQCVISIHPPRGGWDEMICSARSGGNEISIHPPRGGWDDYVLIVRYTSGNFNPPTPWGVGPDAKEKFSAATYFNPPTPWGVGLNCEIS